MLILPPGGFFVLAAVGLLLLRRRPRTGRGLLVGAAVGLYLASTPLVAGVLIRALEAYPARAPGAGAGGAQAIVVLGADVERRAPEYGGADLGELSLQRARYGARLHRETGLPLLVTGGRMQGVEAVGTLLARSLESDFGVPVRWVERHAANTWENAVRSRELLEPDGIARVALVTHAFHMPRAVAAFRAAGLDPVPAPTVFRPTPHADVAEILPSSKALRESHLATHEWLGRAYYALFHRGP